MLLAKLDSFTHVLKMMGDREDPGGSTILWIVGVFVSILMLLLAANFVRRRIRKRRHLGRSLDQLEHLAARNDLNYVEQVTIERMASLAKLPNPAQLATSVVVFDQAVEAWMSQVMQKPWLEMEAQVALLTDIREKLGFRYLPPERKPANTRHLLQDQRLYVLASGQKRFRLLRTSVIDVTDLAVSTHPFTDKSPVRLPDGQEFVVFFWSEDGGEYRFKTRVLKSVERPTPYLYLEHGDSLTTDEGRKTISCDVDLEVVADWVPAADYGRAAASVNLFDRMADKVQSLPMHVKEISGSGFTFATQERAEVNDLLRVQGGKGVPEVLDGTSARLVKVGSSRNFAKFVSVSPEDREAMLVFITPRISAKAFRKRTRGHAGRKT